jgi:hypothetical protein
MLLRDLGEQFTATSADDDGVAGVVQALGQRKADAAGGSRDEDGVSVDSHASSVRRSRAAWQRALIGGAGVPGCRAPTRS